MDVQYIDSLGPEFTLAREDIMTSQVLGMDVETGGFDPHTKKMTLLQISPRPGKVYVFNTHDLNNPNDFEFVVDILADPTKKPIFQNGKFDLQFLRHFFNRPLATESLYDTMIVSTILARGDKRLKHGLGAIAERELNIEVDKTLQKSDFGATTFTEAQIQYAARDADVLHEIRDSQKQKLASWNLERVARLECDCVAAIADTEYDGIYLDASEWLARCQRQQGDHDELSHQIKKILAPTTPIIDLFDEPVINIDSPAQLLKAFDRLGIQHYGSTDEQALKLLKAHHNHQIIDLLVEYKLLATALKRTGPDFVNFINPATGRIHADFFQMEAPSGRMSVRKPALQTMPREAAYRTVFKAQHDGHIITADYSQVELRIMAKQSNDPVLVQAYMNGDDLHNVTAHKVLGEPFDNPDPDKRTIAKNINFGTAYGVSPEGFAVTAGVSVAFAERVLNEYWKVYRVLGDYLRGQASLASDQGRAYTASGRTALIYVVPDDKASYNAARRLGRNFGVQGTGADILKSALYKFRNAKLAQDFDAKIVNIVHDEIVVETNDDPDMVAEVLKASMMEAGIEYLDPIPCDVGVKVGKTWQK